MKIIRVGEEYSCEVKCYGTVSIFSSLVLKTSLKIKFDGKAFNFDKLGDLLKNVSGNANLEMLSLSGILRF